MSSVCDLIVASAVVRHGRLFFRNRHAFDAQVAALKDGWAMEVTVKRQRATRSSQSNRFYWGVVVELIADHTGYTPDEVHDILKAKFIPKRLAVCDGNGEVKDEFVIGGSTRKMNTVEFGEYMNDIRQWAAMDLDLVIPDPESPTDTTPAMKGYGHGV